MRSEPVPRGAGAGFSLRGEFSWKRLLRHRLAWPSGLVRAKGLGNVRAPRARLATSNDLPASSQLVQELLDRRAGEPEIGLDFRATPSFGTLPDEAKDFSLPPRLLDIGRTRTPQASHFNEG